MSRFFAHIEKFQVNRMFEVDEQLTESYLELLKEFTTFLTQRTASLPASRNQRFITFITNLNTDIKQILKIKRNRKLINKAISIDPNVVFSYTNPEDTSRNYHVSIGGEINIVDNVIKAQSLCINIMLEHTQYCKDIAEGYQFYEPECGFHVLRRFHFDYDSQNDDYSKPKFHLQYGGRFQQHYFDLENVHYKLFKPVDYPRLPQQPNDLIILLDFLLREFNLSGSDITKESKWITCVINSEKLWLKPYYQSLMQRLNSGSRSSPLHRVTL